jgi:hypothetical protein
VFVGQDTFVCADNQPRETVKGVGAAGSSRGRLAFPSSRLSITASRSARVRRMPALTRSDAAKSAGR